MNNVVRRFGVATLLALGSIAGAAPSSAATMLYQVDFSSDQIGSQATTGGGPFPRFTPSPPPFGFLGLGAGRVVESAGPLDDQPVLFEQDGTSGFYQLHLDLPALNAVDFDCYLGGSTIRQCTSFDPLSSQFSISFDLTVLGLAPLSPTRDESRFSLLLDAPDVRRLDFASDGSIAIAGGAVNVFRPLTIGQYEFMKVLAVTVNVDLAQDEWSTSINGTELYRDNFGGPINLSTLRFGLGTSTPGAAAIDNIRVLAIPEPTSVALLAMGLGFLSLRGRPRLNLEARA